MWNIILDFLLRIVKTPITILTAFLAGKRSGRKDAELDQYEKSLQDIASAEDARRNLPTDDNSVHNDPYNRDNA